MKFFALLAALAILDSEVSAQEERGELSYF